MTTEGDEKMMPDQPGIAADGASIEGRLRPDWRSAITSAPATRLDGRSAVGRRVRDLYRALMVRLNEPADIVVQADVLAWAELKAAAEVARADLLGGTGRSSNECVRLENLTRRAAATVGLEPGAAEVEKQSLDDLFAEIAAESGDQS